MIPVIAGIAMEMVIDSTALYFGLLSGATLGGNITPIGASANITAIVPAYILIWVLFGV